MAHGTGTVPLDKALTRRDGRRDRQFHPSHTTTVRPSDWQTLELEEPGLRLRSSFLLRLRIINICDFEGSSLAVFGPEHSMGMSVGHPDSSQPAPGVHFHPIFFPCFLPSTDVEQQHSQLACRIVSCFRLG